MVDIIHISILSMLMLWKKEIVTINKLPCTWIFARLLCKRLQTRNDLVNNKANLIHNIL
jgi:hypothetical protein